MRCATGVAEESQNTEMMSNDSGTDFLLRWGRGSDEEGREGRVTPLTCDVEG